MPSCISVTVNEVNNKYLWGCYGRSCLERVIFSLMVILMVGVLLIAGLLCVHIGSGGLRRLSSLMFAQANKYENVDTNGLGVLNNAGGHSLQPELVDLMDDGIDIVRIKTTEEHKVKGTLRSESIVRTKRVCVSGECSSLSRRILQNIDAAQDPCTSFYSFACGGWMARNPPPPRRMVHSVMSEMRDKIDLKLKDLIERIDVHRTDKVNMKLRTFYDSCMDVDSIRTKGFIPAVEFIHGNFSDFLKSPGVKPENPLLFEGGSSTSDELTRLLLNLLKVNGSPLLDITLDISPRNASRYIGVIRMPGKAAILPKLTHSSKDFNIFRKWIRREKAKTKKPTTDSQTCP